MSRNIVSMYCANCGVNIDNYAVKNAAADILSTIRSALPLEIR